MDPSHPLSVLPTESLLQTYAAIRTMQRDEDMSTHQRLARVLRGKQNGLLTAVRARTGLAIGEVSPTSVTPARLGQAGLTLRMLQQEDARLTPQQLMAARVVLTLADFRTLGVKTLAQLWTEVAPPHQLRKWCTHPEQWTGMLQEMTQPPWSWGPEAWFTTHRNQLSARDLKALGVSLDTWFTLDPTLWKRVVEAPHAWLGDANKAQQWVTRAGLSPKRLDMLLAGRAPISSPSPSPSPSSVSQSSASETWI